MSWHPAPLSLVYLHRSGDDQEVLFDQILMGQVDFPPPYWDNVSDSAKVGGSSLPCFLEPGALVEELTLIKPACTNRPVIKCDSRTTRTSGPPSCCDAPVSFGHRVVVFPAWFLSGKRPLARGASCSSWLFLSHLVLLALAPFSTLLFYVQHVFLVSKIECTLSRPSSLSYNCPSIATYLNMYKPRKHM